MAKLKKGDKVFIHTIDPQDTLDEYLYKTGKITYIYNVGNSKYSEYDYEVTFHKKHKVKPHKDNFYEKELIVYKNKKALKILYGTN